MSVTFRDESNESSFTMIGYIDATVTISNHPLTMRSKTLLATAHVTIHNCEDCFVIRFYLIYLISGQRSEKFS